MRPLKSSPITTPPAAARLSSAVSLPEPQATSSALPPAGRRVAPAVRRRQRASAPKERTVLSRSYRRAIRSNIARTAAESRSATSRVPELQELGLPLGRDGGGPALPSPGVELAGRAVQR